MVTSLLSIKLRPKAETSACHVITNSQSFNRWMRSRINHWMRRSLVRCRVILMSIAKSLQKAQLMSKAHPIALPQLFALLPRVEAAHRTPAPPPLAVLPHAASQHHNLTPPPCLFRFRRTYFAHLPWVLRRTETLGAKLSPFTSLVSNGHLFGISLQ